MFHFTKRRKFIVSSLVLAFGLFLIHSGLIVDRYLGIVFLSLLATGLTYWSMWGALPGQIPLLVWVLPTLFTASWGLFYFLLPASSATIVPVLVLYSIGLYALFLSENIFAVASLRTIQLYRSASAVNFLLTLVTAFLAYDTLLSFRLSWFWNGLSAFGVSLPLLVKGCWVVKMETIVNKEVWLNSVVTAMVVGILAVGISFWPVTVTMGSLFLTALVYVLLGLTQAKINGRLFGATAREYLIVGGVVFLVMVLSTRQ